MGFMIITQILLLMLLANAVVYAGIFFINAAFLPDTLSFIYERTNYYARLGLCLVSFLIIGNILFAKGFEWFDGSLVAPLNIVAFVIIQIAIAVILSKTMPSPMLIPAMLAVCASVYWVYLIITVSPK